MRLITADTHPDPDTICPFRRENQARLSESFSKVLPLAQALKLAQFGQITVSLDGTKLAANARKHSAVSYERAGQMLEQLEGEVPQRLHQQKCPGTWGEWYLVSTTGSPSRAATPG